MARPLCGPQTRFFEVPIEGKPKVGVQCTFIRLARTFKIPRLLNPIGGINLRICHVWRNGLKRVWNSTGNNSHLGLFSFSIYLNTFSGGPGRSDVNPSTAEVNVLVHVLFGMETLLFRRCPKTSILSLANIKTHWNSWLFLWQSHSVVLRLLQKTSMYSMCTYGHLDNT